MIDKVEARDSSLTSEKKLMTFHEVADYCDVSKRTIARWVKDRAMPVIKPSGAVRCGVVRFDIDAVDKWLRKKPRSLNVS